MNKDHSFINLHSHSVLSTQDALITVKDLVSEAKKLGHCSCTITEHGHLASMPSFVKECEKQGLKFNVGVEFYFQWDENKKEKSSYHLVVIAKNQQGWLNLLSLQRLSAISVDDGGGHYMRPRILASMLEKHKEGLHISSACISGPVASELLKGKETDARIVAEYFRDTFESFTIEIMPHRLKLVAEANRKLIVLAKDLNIPFITSLDVHIKDKSYIDSYLANGDLRRNRTISDRDNPDIDCLRDPDFWYKGPDEIISVYNDQCIEYKDVIESFKNTLDVDSMINFKWEERKFEQPEFCENADEVLEKTIAKKLLQKFGNKNNIPQEVKERLRHEYDVIKSMNYSNYFLILNDMMEYADSNNIVRGIGRGSAGASLVLYTLGITKINPLDYNLAFSRFLNVYRKSSPPDVDVDLQPEGRMALIEYLKNKYGHDNVIQVSNYSEMKPKAAIKDAGKWIELDFKIVNEITSHIPDKEYNDESELVSLTFEEVKEIPEIRKYIEQYPRLFNVAEKLSGSVRQFNVHAGAVCVLKRPVNEIIPVFKKKDDSGSDVFVSQWNKSTLESVEVNKFDVLGLSSLTILKECEDLTGVKIDDIKHNDKKTWDFFKESKFNLGIFQFIEQKSRKFLRDIQPEKISDLSDCTTLIRPGADAKTYFANKKLKSFQYKFDVPEVIQELKNSYAAIIYQENLINLGASLSGLDLGESDLMRRAMEKGKHEEIEKYKKKFIETCKYPKYAEDMFQWLRDSAQYLFCIAEDSQVSLANGTKKNIQDVVSGENLLSVDEETGKIVQNKTAGSIKMGNKKVYKVKTKSGKELICTPDHRILTESGYKTLNELIIGDKIKTVN